MSVTTIRVQINEDGFSSLHERGVVLGKDPEVVASFLLRDALREYPIQGRHLVLDHPELDRLAKTLGGGDVLNGEDLCLKVERLAGISFHNIRLEFTPGQLEEIAWRANRLGLTPEELAARIVKKMEELFFTHMVGA